MLDLQGASRNSVGGGGGLEKIPAAKDKLNVFKHIMFKRPF